MRKKIYLTDDQSIELDGSVGWLLVYRSQFGNDILPELLPAVEALMNAATAVISASADSGEINLKKAAEELDADRISDIFTSLIGLQVSTILRAAWAMAKNADRSIPLVEEWLNSFDVFPLDIILPEVVNLILESSVSTKNRQSLMSLKETIADSLPRPS